MRTLTDATFSERRHEAQDVGPSRRAAHGGPCQLWLTRARPRIGAEPGQSYSHFLWQSVLHTSLPHRRDWTFIEIDCAPGRYLARLHRRLGYQPHGVDNSPTGSAQARAALERHGLDPAGAVEADLFDPAFQAQHRKRYEVVLSNEFIKHFNDPGAVLREQAAMVKPRGNLVCSIPNLRGYAYPLLRFFARELLAALNCAIMRRGAFPPLFEGLNLEGTFCGYVGVAQFYGVVLKREPSLRGQLACVLTRATDLLYHLMLLTLHGRAPDTRCSPSLLYIGRKMSRGED